MMEKKIKILIVDDEIGIRQLTGMLLAEVGHSTILCEDGEHAISHIDSADILITDFSMPGMNGAELTKLAKQQKPGLPVIIMTGTPEDVPVNHLADAVIEKPFKTARLKEIIDELLSSK